MKERKRIFTTGDLAQILKVAPRTVSKWFDSGKIRGYRIPCSRDRRVPREMLIEFMKANGMPMVLLEEWDALQGIEDDSHAEPAGSH